MTKQTNNQLEQIPSFQSIGDLIFTFRGEKTIVDRDLAMLYGVETKRLNEQVKRNSDRFTDFYFQLSDNEKNELVAKCDRFSALKYSTSNAYVFNEYGILTLSSILKSKTAIEINRRIIKVFVELRKQTIEASAFELMKAKVKALDAEIQDVKTHHLVTEATFSAKALHLSKELMALRQDIKNFNEDMDALQNAHVIIKKPDEGINYG